MRGRCRRSSRWALQTFETAAVKKKVCGRHTSPQLHGPQRMCNVDRSMPKHVDHVIHRRQTLHISTSHSFRNAVTEALTAVGGISELDEEHQGPLLKLLQSGEAPAVQLKRIKAQRPKAKSKAKAKASVKSLEGETVEAKGKEQEAVKATSNVEPAVQREAPIPTRPLAVPGRVALDLDD
ncbi:unnamed protein product [Effrenium voratum]|nr:unnamed protein product [Effrenium voratum]